MKHLLYAAALIEAAELGVQGVDLYIGTMPADHKQAVMLRDPLYGADIDEGMGMFVEHWFQVIVRDPDPQAGYDRALAISQLLKVNRVTEAGIYILKMNPSSLPATYPMGDADDLETAVRMHVAYALTD